MSGEWVKLNPGPETKHTNRKPYCTMPDTWGVLPGSLWRCECGQLWQYDGKDFDFRESWDRWSRA